MTSQAEYHNNRPLLADALPMMSDVDKALALQSNHMLDLIYRKGRHDVVAVAHLADGQTLTGVHAEASQGRASICAEGSLISQSIAARSPIVSIISVLRRNENDYLIEPCGVCAELLIDYYPDTFIWVGTSSAKALRVQARDLLPFHQIRTSRI
ncbi:MAG: hypothetical protein LKI34_07435 [Bifidobacterium tibiigranuli]|jgi:cytidine deaminase|uniref:hypothetical protein n=1 Tax=Bifidobacterium tibiigranuli TaxID=2172043 RepID=UPI0026ECBE0E|nr:hypothetical protein [Bifidobacterium tibiigranuli]MCI1674028.1 hypothetical protein [Bifidobacterium tibiigranuli]MCI1714000.1 hypothetical protein [Bifidobacterium tibiigranuli]MCI1833390.1 hypothetical protein [Bifidobacterium tibiigranuli]